MNDLLATREAFFQNLATMLDMTFYGDQHVNLRRLEHPAFAQMSIWIIRLVRKNRRLKSRLAEASS